MNVIRLAIIAFKRALLFTMLLCGYLWFDRYQTFGNIDQSELFFNADYFCFLLKMLLLFWGLNFILLFNVERK